MARVELASQSWGWVADQHGEGQASVSVTLKNPDGTNATHWSAITGGSSSSGSLTTNSDGTLSRFIESGVYDMTVGATTRRVEASAGTIAGVVSAAAYLAYTNPVQEAIDDATAGEVVEIDRDYVLAATLDTSSSVKLRGRGEVTLDYSGVPKTGGVRYGMRVRGSVGSAGNLTANAVKGEYAATISSGDVTSLGLAVGDWVQVGTSGAGYYSYGGGVNVDRGEIKKIRTIAAGVLTFEQALYDNYTTANAGFVRKISFVENVHIEGVKFKGLDAAADGSRGLSLEYVNGFTVNNCEFEYAEIYGVSTKSCIRGDISHNRFRGIYYDGVTGTIFYGIANLESSQWIRVHANHGERLRHLWVCSSSSTGQGYWGAPRFITVVGNVAENMEGGATGRSWAYEHHGFGDHIVITGNIADGCYGGINIRGPGVKAANNTIRNWYYRAIEVHDDIVNASDIQIVHNTVGGRSIEGGGEAQSRAVYLGLAQATTIDLVVAHNTLEVSNVAATQPAFEVVGAVEGKGLQIKDNTFKYTAEPPTHPLQVTPNNVLIEANKFFGCSYGIRVFGTGCKILRNFMHGVNGASAGHFIFTDTASHVIVGNVGWDLFTGVQLSSGANNCFLSDNVMDSATDARAFNVNAAVTGTQSSNNRRLSGPATVASGATIVVPVGSKFVVVSGTADITAITAAGHGGETKTLRFSGTAATNGIVDGSNLKMAGNLVYTPDDTITFYCDGTNFYETGRSVN